MIFGLNFWIFLCSFEFWLLTNSYETCQGQKHELPHSESHDDLRFHPIVFGNEGQSSSTVAAIVYRQALKNKVS